MHMQLLAFCMKQVKTLFPNTPYLPPARSSVMAGSAQVSAALAAFAVLSTLFTRGELNMRDVIRAPYLHVSPQADYCESQLLIRPSTCR